MRIADALELLSWPLELARAATAGLGARVDPLARVVSRRLGRGRAKPPGARGEPATPAVHDLRSRAEAARFWLGPAAPAGVPAARGAQPAREPGDLPAAYGRDHLVLVARDPWWVFAFWEVTPQTRERARGTLGAEADGATTVLRLYDASPADGAANGSLASLDVEVTPAAESWYVNVGRPAASFRAEIGLRTAGGQFLPLARSNVAATPRATPSAESDVRRLEFGATGPAWSPDQRPRGGPGDDTANDDGRLAPGS